MGLAKIKASGVDLSELKSFYVPYTGEDGTINHIAPVSYTHLYTPDNTDGETLRSEIEHYAEVSKEIFDKYY